MTRVSQRPELIEALGPHPALRALAGEPGVHVVGGAVRDALAGADPRELDLVVEGDAAAVARARGGAARRPRRRARALRHGDGARADGARSTSPRRATERYPRPGALPEVRARRDACAEDLARRDFTVNAIAVRAGRRRAARPGPARSRTSRPACCACCTSARSSTTRRGCCASPATPARLGFAPSRRRTRCSPRRWRTARWPR